MTTASNARARVSRGRRRDAAGPLPTFFIIGAMRSGTTALSRYMGAHPDVFMAPEKEVHYFDRLYERGIDWYRGRFAGATGQRAIGEATQTYMYLPEATERMAGALPDAKLVAILRNPVDRAYSHYWMNRSLRVEPLPFREALAAYPDNPPPSGQMYPYLERGRYLAQFERVCTLYPRSALHVLLLEDLIREPDATFAELCRFLDIDDGFRPSNLGVPINRHIELRSLKLRAIGRRLPKPLALVVGRLNSRPVSYPAMDAATRSELLAHYAPDNARLADWLGRDLSVWNR